MRYIVILLICFGTGSVYSQEQSNLPDSEKEVIKNFQANLDDAHLIPFPLTATAVDTNRAFIRAYKLSEQPIELEYPAPKMKPLSMPQEENPKPKSLYVKAGYGLPSNPFVEAAYGLQRDKFNISLHGLYESIKDSDKAWLKYQDMEANVAAAYDITDNIGIYSDLSYNQKKLPFTQNSDDGTLLKIDVPTVRLGVKNISSTRPLLDYDLAYTYRQFNNSLLKDNIHQIDLSLRKYFNSNERTSIGLEVRGVNNRQTVNDNDQDALLVARLQGYHNEDRWNIKAGIGIGAGDETVILPELELHYILSKQVQPYIAVRSDAELNSGYNLSRYMPYISDLLVTDRHSIEYVIGGRGQYEQIKYEVFAGYGVVNNQALFVKTGSTFATSYDKVKTITIGINTDAEIVRDLTISGHIAYYNHKTTDIAEAYQLPTFKSRLTGTYGGLLDGKLKTQLGVTALSGIKTKVLGLDNETFTLKPQWNIDLLAEYTITDHLNGFIQVNNILNNENPQIYDFPQIGINPQIGVKLRL